ncbi:hypothetical protein H8D40_02930, partial [Candidatus Bathyarchaeota archaeon]|nr:hypothetical protein [Candidatus Bathyarchaeota archaeon]
MKSLAIKARQTDSGVEIRFRGSKYVIEYPDEIWKEYPREARDVLFDNLVYAETIHLPLTHKTGEIVYDTPPPFFQPYFFQNMVMDLPSCADVDGTSTAELLKSFMNTTVSFSEHEIKFPDHVEETREDSSVVSISFGKDSLLTWAVCREMGMNPQLCYVVEPLLTYEEKHKMVLAE